MSSGRRAALILLAVIVASAGPAGQAPVAAAQNAEPLEVMSFNIRYGTARDGDNRWELRRDTVFEVIESHRPDVLGVQEALHFQLVELVEAMPRYERIGVGRSDGLAAGEYAAIFVDRSRLEVLEQDTFWFSDTPDVPGSTSWGNDITRICTWARLRDRASGRSFYLYNVHWDHRSQPSRERSAGLLLEMIARRASVDDPVVVTGDFNAGESNAAFQALVQTSETTLRDTFRLLHPDAQDVGTFNGFEGTASGDKIDAVLASEGWDVLSAEIVRDVFQGRYPSDHFPVTATLVPR